MMKLLFLKGKLLLVNILKELTPPIIVKSVRKNMLGVNCSGEYKTYKEAALACTGFGYEQEDLIQVVFEKTKRYKDYLTKATYLEPSIQDTRLFMAISLVHNTTQHNTTQHNTTQHNTTQHNTRQVIDFGGSLGGHYFFAHSFFKDRILLQWHVVESKSMAAAGKSLEDGRLYFHDNLDVVIRKLKNADLFFSSGTLQYVSDPYATLEKIVASDAQYIFLTRLALTTEQTELVTIQTSRLSENGIGSLPTGMKDGTAKYPVVFARKERVEEILLTRNYKIKMLWKEHEGAYRWKGHSIDMYGLFAERHK